MDVPHTPGVKERIMADEGLRQETRRWEEKLNGQGRILIRPSGTEALIRVMVEAKTTEIAHQVASVLADFIKNCDFITGYTNFPRRLDKLFSEKV